MNDPINPTTCISSMFDQIALTYDRNNRILSFGIDIYWRYKMNSLLPKKDKLLLLDCATGTGDQLLSFFRHTPQLYEAAGIDISSQMLEIAKEKLQPYAHQVILETASAENIPYLDESFDCISVSFGIRNMKDTKKCLKEFYRVLKIHGRLLILEFSLPTSSWIKKAYLTYLNHLLPHLGKFFSAHPDAYQYLSRTIQEFPSGENFCQLLRHAGFQNLKTYPLTFGVVTIYQGEKK